MLRPTLALVSPTGEPVGGQWQRWVDRSTAPTIPGSLILDVDAPGNLCGAAWDCSAGAVMHGTVPSFVPSAADDPYPAETWVYTGPGQGAWQFNWELGHQFDWALLTDTQRSEFELLFRNMTTPWWDSLQGLAQGTEDGLEGEFAADYADCATSRLLGYTGNGAYAIPPLTSSFMARFCELLDRAGREDGAIMPRRQVSFAW
jgi:hypothetical protein